MVAPGLTDWGDGGGSDAVRERRRGERDERGGRDERERVVPMELHGLTPNVGGTGIVPIP
jgi:hypothetical protein